MRSIGIDSLDAILWGSGLREFRSDRDCGTDAGYRFDFNVREPAYGAGDTRADRKPDPELSPVRDPCHRVRSFNVDSVQAQFGRKN